jgi:hypothetical protein
MRSMLRFRWTASSYSGREAFTAIQWQKLPPPFVIAPAAKFLNLETSKCCPITYRGLWAPWWITRFGHSSNRSPAERPG